MGTVLLFTISGFLIVTFIALAKLWRTSSSLRYYVKFTSFYLFILGIATVSIVWSIFRPKNVNNIRGVTWLTCWLPRLYGLNMELRNSHHIRSDKPFVVVSNHQSALDMMCMSWAWPQRCVPLAKQEAMYMGAFGLAAYLCGTIFVKRHNTKQALGVMSKSAELVHERNVKVWIFPEGTRNFDGRMLPFKKGAFHLAIDAQIPIVPVVISSYRHFLDKDKKLFGSGKIILTCLPPISSASYKTSDVTRVTNEVRSLMIDQYNKSTFELLGYLPDFCQPEKTTDQESSPKDTIKQSVNSERSEEGGLNTVRERVVNGTCGAQTPVLQEMTS